MVSDAVITEFYIRVVLLTGTNRFSSQKGMSIGSVRQISSSTVSERVAPETKTMTHSQTGKGL